MASHLTTLRGKSRFGYQAVGNGSDNTELELGTLAVNYSISALEGGGGTTSTSPSDRATPNTTPKKARKVSFSAECEDEYLLSRSASGSSSYSKTQMSPLRKSSFRRLADPMAPEVKEPRSKAQTYLLYAVALAVMTALYATAINITTHYDDRILTGPTPNPFTDASKPISTVDPLKLMYFKADRPKGSRPGPIFGQLHEASAPLPTNAWYQNLLLGSGRAPENQVFQVPYVIDLAGPIPVSESESRKFWLMKSVLYLKGPRTNGVTVQGGHIDVRVSRAV
jgi:endoglucanase Acf2